ncbi:MAG: virulence factor SrfB [Sphingobacteriaceae bacterium]|nr:virulence factor SrfB [Sphingobacteriaceae bacterium]
MEDYNKNSLTLGSVDIGAGTTDVMIATYKYEDSSSQCTFDPSAAFLGKFLFSWR